MALHSMTGFARVDFDVGGARYAWETKSVNGRGLEVRLRLPPGFDRLEPDLRRLVRGTLNRGNCQISLQADRPNAEMLFQLNENALALAVAVSKRLAG